MFPKYSLHLYSTPPVSSQGFPLIILSMKSNLTQPCWHQQGNVLTSQSHFSLVWTDKSPQCNLTLWQDVWWRRKSSGGHTPSPPSCQAHFIQILSRHRHGNFTTSTVRIMLGQQSPLCWVFNLLYRMPRQEKGAIMTYLEQRTAKRLDF